MFLTIDFIGIVGILIAAASLFMTTLMFSLGKGAVNRIWGLFCIAVLIWGGSFYFITTTNSPDTARIWWKISHVGVALIPALFIHFVHVFLRRNSLGDIVVLSTAYALTGVFLFADVATNLLIDQMRYVFNSFYYDSPPGPLYLPFVVYFHAAIVYGHYMLLRAYLSSTDIDVKESIRYFFMATFVGFLGGGLSFSPVFGVDIYPITIATVPLYPIIMGYAILKHKLFNVKVVTAQIAALLIFIFSFIQLFSSGSSAEYILNGAFVLVALGLGGYLIRSVSKEVEARELIEEQKKELEQANEEKSEFMTFASHEIRNPLTAMRGYASLIVDGTIGPADVRDAAQKIMVTGNEVIDLISQFLNKSKMELGQLTYAIVDIDLGKLVHDMADRFKPHAKQAGLYFKIDQNLSENYIVSADEGKVKEVVGNIIDNSIKYTKTGGVSVTLSKFADRARIVISDTGAGIPPDVMPYLFQKFSRADAKKLNLFGTGLGLFLARTYMEAMHGKIWAESDGKDKGSRFIIELPLK